MSHVEGYWTKFTAGTTPTSTQLNPEFLNTLQPKSLLLDVGSCSGRASRILKDLGHRVMGFDLNRAELELSLDKDPAIPIFQASGTQIPLPSESVDCAIALAVLGAVDRPTRERMIEEMARCVKPGGWIYNADFARITDPDAKTSDGKYWRKVYKSDAKMTGEDGSVRVLNPDGSVKFIGHHFGAEEMASLYCRYELEPVLVKTTIRTVVSGHERPNWNVWAQKPRRDIWRSVTSAT